MVELFLLALFCSLFCLGFEYATLYVAKFDNINFPQKHTEVLPDKKEILWFIRYYGNKYLPLYITKPLYGCPICMSSCHGTIFYWTYIIHTNVSINYFTFIIWAAMVVVVAGTTRVLKGMAQL